MIVNNESVSVGTLGGMRREGGAKGGEGKRAVQVSCRRHRVLHCKG